MLASFVASPSGVRASGLLKRHGMSVERMYVTVYREVRAIEPALLPRCKYTAKILCGPTLWGLWKFDGQRKAAGMCLKHLVKHRCVGLVLHRTRKNKGTKQYLLRHTGS